MSTAGWALQKALFVQLSADAGLQTLTGTPARVFDDAPGDVPLPYVQIGESVESDWSTATEPGAEHQITIHVWSRGGGRFEARAILDAIHGALQDAAPPLESHRLVNLRFLTAQVVRQDDGETYHGIARFRAVTEPL